MAKKYEVIKRSVNAAKNIAGFDLQGKKREFSKAGVMYLTDKGEANHLEDKYGPKGTGDVLVSEIPDWDSSALVSTQEGHKPIHQNFFTVPELPWKKEAKDGANTE